MTIEQDRARYFWLAENGDPVSPDRPEPATFEDSRITPLIDMAEYAEQLIAALALVGNGASTAENERDFIYIAGWWLGLVDGDLTPPGVEPDDSGFSIERNRAFNLDPEDHTQMRLLSVLRDKANAGVEVRILGWLSYSVMSGHPHPLLWIVPPLQSALAYGLKHGPLLSMAAVNNHTMASIKAVREIESLQKSAVLNTLGHSAGAVHIKGAVIGTTPVDSDEAQAIAFSGGLDLTQDRWAQVGHVPNTDWESRLRKPIWHDVQAAIAGPAAQGFYDLFRNMWNEAIGRKVRKFRHENKRMVTYVKDTPVIKHRVIASSLVPGLAGNTFQVQSLRTIPTFNYEWFNCLPEGKEPSFAAGGRFEVRDAWKKAIENAQRYIYFEDQGYTSREMMTWINGAIRANPELRVIFAMQGAGDPNDAPEDRSDIKHETFNKGLLGVAPQEPLDEGINPSVLLSPAQQNQIRVVKLWGESARVQDKHGLDYEREIESVDDSPPNEIHMRVRLEWNDRKPLEPNAMLQHYTFVETAQGRWRLLGNLAATKNDDVIFRLEKTMPPPVVGEDVFFLKTAGVFTHSKVTIIDDTWAMIGSANFMRRSLYTDWEHAVAFLDEGDGVKEFRKRLWAEHFGVPDPTDDSDLDNPLEAFDNIEEALAGWDPDDQEWNATLTSPNKPQRAADDLGPDYIQLIELPLPTPSEPMSPRRRAQYLHYRDPDSRQPWGGVCKA